MSKQARAAIATGNGDFVIDEILLDDPNENQVLLEMKASGVCHTDWDSMTTWNRTLIMGHEGAGVVLKTGPGVNHVKEGDRVLLNWAIPCVNCFQCRHGSQVLCESKPIVPELRYRYRGKSINAAFDLGTMATHAVVPKQAAVKIEIDIPFTSACILGCAVMTGWGSVVNAAKVEKGSSVAVLGTGGVGLSVIQGALHCCAGKIIAIDVNPARLELARQFGATHLIAADREDKGLLQAAREVKELTGNRGADYAFECTAVPELGSAPLAMIRHCGTAVGVSGIEQVVPFDMELFEWDKIYINPLYGKCNPFVDFPVLLNLYAQGRLKLDEMVTRTYPLEQLGQAFEDMRRGINAKGVLVL